MTQTCRPGRRAQVEENDKKVKSLTQFPVIQLVNKMSLKKTESINTADFLRFCWNPQTMTKYMHCGDMDSFVLCGNHGLILGPFSGRFKNCWKIPFFFFLSLLLTHCEFELK